MAGPWLALWAPIALGTPTLAPGRYVGVVDTGIVWLVLAADGAATYGEAPYRWRQADGVLHLDGPTPLALTLDAAGRCLTGPPFGHVCLRPVPVVEPTPAPPVERPAAFVGAWQHTASGGTLRLDLSPDGGYVMVQQATGDPVVETRGAWHGDAAGLVLTPAGGGALRYRARRAGADLLLGGGDLPLDVRFSPVEASPVR
ncbi:MAG: hypothetical protein H6706_16830 [Myxococcales bacterium]|nr:hypothetical protein [Myxococcales bacterium]